MSIDRTDPPAADAAHPETNGHPAVPNPAEQRFYFVAQIAKLRHWCRDLLDTSPAADTLPAELVADLRDTLPAMSPEDAIAVFKRQRAAGLSFPDTAPDSPNPEVRRLSGERERLRETFFALYDATAPLGPWTEADVARLAAESSERSIADIIAELEREIPG